MLEEHGFDLDYARKCIKANKHNHVTTTYYLLLQKFLRRGHKSPADISLEKFKSVVMDYPSKFPSKIEKSK